MKPSLFNFLSRGVLLLPLLFLGTLLAAQRPFVTTWKTDNPGTSSATSITIPTGSGYFIFDVDWDNDGVYDDLGVSGSITHDYGIAGTYTVAIRGTFPWIRFSEGGDKQKILDVVQWGDIEWASLQEAFSGCTNLNVSATDAPDLSRVTKLCGTFQECTSPRCVSSDPRDRVSRRKSAPHSAPHPRNLRCMKPSVASIPAHPLLQSSTNTLLKPTLLGGRLPPISALPPLRQQRSA